MERIRLRQAVIVEGKYDKIRLEPLLDALILTTNGFQIYKNHEQRALIRQLARTCGLIVLTDSDAAGFQLRGHIAGMVPKDTLTHIYIPDIFGKEKRKRAPSAEGKLGVEGMSREILREAFQRAGVLDTPPLPADDPITHQDFYADGLTGAPNSAQLRRKFYTSLGLPQRLSTSSAVTIINRMLSREEYRRLVKTLWQNPPSP